MKLFELDYENKRITIKSEMTFGELTKIMNELFGDKASEFTINTNVIVNSNYYPYYGVDIKLENPLKIEYVPGYPLITSECAKSWSEFNK